LAEEASLYRVADVAVDVTAATAAKARDQALIQAQHQAFDQLMTRLNVTKTVPASDDDVALMVHAFEVQKEQAVAQRYISTVTVSFKPEAVQQFLNKKGVAYSAVQAQPVIVLPVLRTKARSVLWEDETPWRSVWEEQAHKATLVPMSVPSGDLDDIAKIGADEAVSGSPERIQAIMQKYGAGGVVVAVLQTDALNGSAPVQGAIKALVYASDGRVRDTVDLDMAPSAGTKELDAELKESIGHVIHTIEANWRKEGGAVAPVTSGNAGTAAGAGLTALPMDVPVPTLAAWSQIRNKLNHVPSVSSTSVVTMTRGLVHIEVQFRGDLTSLQGALQEQGLHLTQTPSGSWVLGQDGAESAY